MKKLFLALMAVATIALVGCNKQKNEPTTDTNTNGNGKTEKTGDIQQGWIEIQIQVPDGEECHGIYLKGTLDGSKWTGENEYLGENGPVAAEEAWKFVRMAEKSEWFKVQVKVGTNMQVAVCQKYPNDGIWQGKSRAVTVVADKTTIAGATEWQMPQFSIPADVKPGVLALKIGGWENSECVEANQAGRAIWTMRTAVELPEGAVVGITGTNLVGYVNWDHQNPIIMEKQSDGSYMAINDVSANCTYKYVLKLNGEPAFQDKHGHIINGNSDNLVMPVSREPIDEIDGWLELDKIYGGSEFVDDEHVPAIIGPAVGGWGDNDDVVFTYVGENEKVYTWKAENVVMTAGDFKIRMNKQWDECYGWSDLTINGDKDNFEAAESDNNVNMKADATYSKVEFSLKWNGVKAEDVTLTFTK